MNLDTSRKRPIPGYEHPESTNVNRNSQYKTFTEGKKAKKIENFGTTTIGNQYATLTTETEKNVCPVCNEPAIITCNCVYGDNKCELGHSWYTDRDGKSIRGNPHT